MNEQNERLHQPEEFNSAFASTLCAQANDCLTRWREQRDTWDETWRHARRKYAETLRACHVDGYSGALEPMDWFDEDVLRIFIRAAAPTKNRPRQCRISFYSNPSLLIDIDPAIGELIRAGLTTYRGHTHMTDDEEGHAKWVWLDVPGNNYGRLLSDDAGETAVGVTTLRELSPVWAI